MTLTADGCPLCRTGVPHVSQADWDAHHLNPFAGAVPRPVRLECSHAATFPSRSAGYTLVCLKCGARYSVRTNAWHPKVMA